jgi:predicted metal-dependent hydrolase
MGESKQSGESGPEPRVQGPEGEERSQKVAFGGERIEFRLRRSKRKTLAITVRPDMTVVVTAPEGADVEAVKGKVRKRAVWIRKQQRFFERYLPAVPPRRYVSGETHRYLGRQYRLKVVEGAKGKVRLQGQFIWVEVRGRSDTDRVRRLVEAWYVEHARAAFGRSLETCLRALHGCVKGTLRLHLRRMPKRWGSWTQPGAIYLNPELVRAPRSCIDYVVTHELCHLAHGDHGREFFELLRRTMPDWEQRKARLESVMAE